ncbi:MAG: sugar phosphate isomerase/epimerase [Planctomycetota bacterium]
MSIQYGAQMYTLREHCQTPSDIAKSCKKVKAMGYDGIQASAAGFNDIDAGELRRILDDNGLVCGATHKSMDLLADADAAAAYHEQLGCTLTAIGGFGFGGESRASWGEFTASFSKAAAACAAKGLRVGYHNHSHEWSPFEIEEHPESISPKDTPMEMLAEGLEPPAWFELDVYWVAHGGGDPAAWIDRLAGRVYALHYKDMTITPTREPKMCEVGAGNLNWPRIRAAAASAGVEWVFVERDSGDLDPFDSLQKSIENIRAWG